MGPVVVGDGERVPAQRPVGVAAIVIGVGVAGIERDGGVVVGDGALEFTLAVMSYAAVVDHLGVVRFEAQHQVIIADRGVVEALGIAREAAVVVGEGVIGHQHDRRVVVLDRLVLQVLGAVGDAPVVEDNGEALAVQLAGVDRLGIEPDRFVDIAVDLGLVGRACVLERVGARLRRAQRERQGEGAEQRSARNGVEHRRSPGRLRTTQPHNAPSLPSNRRHLQRWAARIGRIPERIRWSRIHSSDGTERLNAVPAEDPGNSSALFG